MTPQSRNEKAAFLIIGLSTSQRAGRRWTCAIRRPAARLTVPLRDGPTEHHRVVLVCEVVAVRDESRAPALAVERPEVAIDHDLFARIERDDIFFGIVVG